MARLSVKYFGIDLESENSGVNQCKIFAMADQKTMTKKILFDCRIVIHFSTFESCDLLLNRADEFFSFIFSYAYTENHEQKNVGSCFAWNYSLHSEAGVSAMRRHLIIVLSTLIMNFMLLPNSALARSRSKRMGFTFGTLLRSIEANDQTNPGTESDRTTQNDLNSSLVSPYVGYSFESFGFGLSYAVESRLQKSKETTAQGDTILRSIGQVNQGVSLYGRYLFAEIFFFEGGVGLVQDTRTVESENRTQQDGGSFEGKSTSYSIKGTGPGYHASFGLELPITAGFYFTSAYQTRMVTLWDYKGGGDLGGKRSLVQKREVLFGIAYYNQ